MAKLKNNTIDMLIRKPLPNEDKGKKKLKNENNNELTRKTLITKDKAKVKAYADSLDAYNKTKDIENPKYYEKGSEPSWYTWKGNDRDILNKFMKKNNIDLNYEYYRTNKFPGKVQPIEVGDFGEGMAYPIYKKPVQPYQLLEDEIINPISSIDSKEINIEEEGVNPVEFKNKKVSVKEPEHFLDISEPNGKGTKRMYFDTREELENFQKENPMLKTGSFSRAKIKPEVLEILKKKK